MGSKPEVVVITGASAGIGRATVRRFAEAGAHIGLLARGKAGLEAAKREVEERGGRVLVVPTDVAHSVQCPYCIDAFAQSCLEAGSNTEQMTEAIHVASGVRGGASLIHGLQALNAIDKVSM